MALSAQTTTSIHSLHMPQLLSTYCVPNRKRLSGEIFGWTISPSLLLYYSLLSLANPESLRRSVMSDSLRFHGLQLARLLCPWNSPGKNKLEWVDIPFSGETSRDQTQVSCAVFDFRLSKWCYIKIVLKPWWAPESLGDSLKMQNSPTPKL